MTTDDSKPLIRGIRSSDLDAVNRVITECVMGWQLPERVKRLSLGSYLYRPQDLDFLDFLLAETIRGEIAGVAAWEPAAAGDLPPDKRGMLLHGLFVAPRLQRQAIGSRLIDAAIAAVREQHVDGLLVKAQAGAVGFFRAQGFTNLPVVNPERDYPHRWWRAAG